MIHFLKKLAANIPPASAGKVRFFVDMDDRPKAKTETGALIDFVGPQGVGGTVSVGNVSTGAAGSSVVITNTGTPENAVLNITIPRGDKGIQGDQGFAGWSPQLAVVADGERRVLRLTAWVGGTGTAPTEFVDQYLGSSGFTSDIAQAVDIRGPAGQTGVAPSQNTFANVQVGTSPTPTVLAADNALDTLTVNAGDGVTLAADANLDSLTITNSDRGSVARTAHEAAADPHPQYTTTAEAAAAAPVQSVNGSTGAVTVYVPARASYTGVGAANTTVADNDLATLTVPANTLAAGATFTFNASALQTNAATTGGTFNFYVKVNGTRVLNASVAAGTTAQTNRPMVGDGVLTFKTAGAAGTMVATVRNNISGVLPVIASSAAAGSAINTTATVTIAVGFAMNAAATGASYTPIAAAISQVS